MNERLLLTVPEAAARLGVGRSFLYSVIQKGELTTIKLGRSRRVPVAEMERYVERLQDEQA